MTQTSHPPHNLPVERATDDPKTLTDDTGHYRFAGLERGTHKITLDPATLPTHLRPNSDEDTPVLWITPGQTQTSAALSSNVRFTAKYERTSGDISGMVFIDLDADGHPDANEPGIPNVLVIDPTVHQYFVPFDDSDLWTLFVEKGACNGGTPLVPLLSYLFVTSGSDSTIYYYDHWEDGYDVDPLDPGATTETGILDAGVTQIFQSDIDPDLVGQGPPFYYDGRDRITIFGEEGAVVRLVYPSALAGDPPEPGTILAAAWEVPEAADWGAEYIATVGEDLDFNGDTTADDHDYSGLEIMAWQPNTQVYYNSNLVATLNPGEVYFVDGENNGSGGGGIDSTDVITTNKSVQVQMLTGACGAAYSAHGYTLQPVDVWNKDYWGPVPGFTCQDVDTDIYLHNPNDSAINVTTESNLGTLDVPIPANSTISLLDYVTQTPGWPDISTGTFGVHLFSDYDFWGMSVIDSSSNQVGASRTYDWGYSLVPVFELSSQAVVGYAPGNELEPPTGNDNGNLAFVTAVTDTVVYVDLNQDGLPDPFDMNGDGDRDDYDVYGIAEWDEPLSALGVSLQAGQVLRVGDPNDHDLRGAIIYTPELDEKIAIAWGQDPCTADVGAPFLDLGYTILPLPVSSLAKTDALAVDADLTGDVTPGDTLTYTLVLHNSGLGSMNHVVLTDSLPYTYTDFVVGSLEVSTPPPLPQEGYFDGSTWSATPISNAQMLTLTWDTLDANRTITINFRVQLHTDIPITVTEITNSAIVDADNTDPRPSEDPEDPYDPDTDTPIGWPLLSTDKSASPDVIQPGDTLTYTIVVSNTGAGIALDLAITDVLPSGIEYISGTLDITWPQPQLELRSRQVTRTAYFHSFYADDFDLTITQTSQYTGNDGPLAWTTNWTEFNDDDTPSSGEIQAVEAPGEFLSAPAFLRLMEADNDDAGVWRIANLSEFQAPLLRYYVRGAASNTQADDQYSVGVSGLAASRLITSEVYSGEYTLREFSLLDMAYNDSVTTIFTATSGMDPDDVYSIENVAIFESEPERTITETLTWEQLVLSYITVSDTDPASYDPFSGYMVITENTRLPSGGFITVSFQAQATIPLTFGLTLTNTACTTAANWLWHTSPPCADALVQVVGPPEADLSVDKSSRPLPAVPGQALTYTIVVNNHGPGMITALTLVDELPAVILPPINYVPSQGDYDSVSGDWTNLTLYENEQIALTIVGLLDPDFEGILQNTVVITPGDGALDPNPGNNQDTDYNSTGDVADLSLSKTSQPVPAVPGLPITYTIVVTNSGPSSINAITLTDDLPPDILNPVYTPSAGSYDSGTGAWTGLNFAAGDHLMLTITGLLNPAFVGVLQNTAVVTPGGGAIDPDPGDAGDSDDNPAAPSADLALDKTANPPFSVIAGDDLTYTLTIYNAGPSYAQDVVVTDTLPAGVTFVNATPPFTFNDPNVTWQLGSLAPQASRALTVVVTVNLGVSGTLTNTAVISSSSTPDPLDDNNNDQVPVRLVICATQADDYEPDNLYPLAAPITADGTPQARSFHIFADKDWITFEARAGKLYTITTFGLADDVDTLLQLYDTDGSTLLAENDNHPPGNSASQITWSAPATGAYFARITHADPTYDPGFSLICGNHYNISVRQQALSLYKTAQDLNGAPLHIGDEILYTVVAVNELFSTQTNVIITDPIPDFTTYTPASAWVSQGGVSGPDPLVADFGSLQAGQAATLTFRVTVNPDAAGQIIQNSAWANSDQQITPVPVGPVEPEPGGGHVYPGYQALGVQKLAEDIDGGPLYPGEEVLYTVHITNLLTTTQNLVTIQDLIPEHTHYISGSASLSQGSVSGPDPLLAHIGDLEADQSATLNFRVSINVPLASGTLITNTAIVTSSQTSTPALDIAVVQIANAAPQGNNDSYVTFEDTPLNVADPGLLTNDSDPNGDDLHALYHTNPTNGVLTLNSDGSFTYVPNADFYGVDVFTYTVSDGQLNDSAQVNIEVQRQADLSITKQYDRGAVDVEFTLVVQNLGPSAADGAVMSDEIISEIENVTWSCVGANGAVCGGSGAGNSIHDTITSFPADSVVTYTIVGLMDIFDLLANEATITAPTDVPDPDLGNNTASVGRLFRLFLILICRH